MIYEVTCKHCGAKFRISDNERAQSTLVCKSCGDVNVPPYRYQAVAKNPQPKGFRMAYGHK